ncbi:cytochrome c oxidase assembly protein COX18, mitochondrial [Pectinophora gossypiella]|uniref:cytochrome c oxidase assembly protein COX18, mitochondrial n=1 Tax=Pectinophora gossypiella TaxID=13191 RepID=UPI00214E79D1|nr:cytochrome c oxidase assembly protein COX18, mitochondrial [Pectinophora gossypiella]
MNCYRFSTKLKFSSLVQSSRAFSVLSNGVECSRREIFVQQYPKHLQKNILTPFTCHKRTLSLDGFVKWQEQTYSSIANSSLVNFMQEGLLYVHDTTGLPWWATIVTSTVLVRTLMTLPLTVYQNFILAKVENISLELKDLVNELKKETAIARKAYNLTDKQTVILYRRSLKKQWRKLIERDNCHPFKASMVIWFQIPIWVCISFALRNLVYMHPPDPSAVVTFMELSAGGIGWIPNLTEPDHSLILPVAFGLINLAIIEIQSVSKLRQPSKMYNVFTNVFRVFSVVMIPVAASVPSCMCLYWVTSSGFGLMQNLMLLSPALRRKLKIPEAPSELENPYSHIKGELSAKLQRIVPKKLK